jgi:hypothetical protein
MRRWVSYAMELCCWGAMLLLLGLAAGIFALLGGGIQPADIRAILVDRPALGYLLAVLWVGMALYFAGLVIGIRRRRALITHMGARGAIRISPRAVRDFIARVLEEELDLPDCRVRLRPAAGKEGALIVLVQAPLPLGQNVIEVGEHVQELLKARVEERIGIVVDQVEVFTSGLHPSKEGAPPQKRSHVTHFSEGDFEGDLRE